MNQQPLEINLTPNSNSLWLQSLRWLNPAHYELAVGAGDLQGNYRATAEGRLLFHLIPSVLTSHERQEMFRLALVVARNKALNTRRIRNVGGGEHSLTKAGTPSLFARARQLKVLRNAKEGTFGFEASDGSATAVVPALSTVSSRRSTVNSCRFANLSVRWHGNMNPSFGRSKWRSHPNAATSPLAIPLGPRASQICPFR